MVLPDGLTVVMAPDRFIPLMRARLVITGDGFAADTVAFAQRGLPIDHDVEVAKEVLALPATRLGPELAAVFSAAQITVLRGRAPSVAAGFHAFGAVADPMIRRDATPAAAAPASK